MHSICAYFVRQFDRFAFFRVEPFDLCYPRALRYSALHAQRPHRLWHFDIAVFILAIIDPVQYQR